MTTLLPKFDGRAFLAPMAGISDPALRLVCKRRGAGLVVTELTSVHSVVAKDALLRERGLDITNFIEFSEQERPLSVQLFGSDLDALAKAADIVSPHFDILDYNMGCPAPHITQQMAGGALLQTPDLTRRIFRTLVGCSVDRPVTVKMRAGVTDGNRRLFLNIARIAYEEGISMITLHPRTVSQGYSGTADWSLIRELKQHVPSMPITGNGDITTPERAKEMLDYTGCDYVMVGRAAMSNPAIFEQINDYLDMGTYKHHSLKSRLDLFFEYLECAAAYNIKLTNIKTHAMNFVRGVPGAARIRERISTADSLQSLYDILTDDRVVIAVSR